VSEPAITHELPTELVPPGCTANGTRRRLLTAAIELFAARGYHGVSVRDIASHMGVQPSSLYAHYRSKEELFSDLVFLANDEIHQRLMNALLNAGSDPAAQLSTLVHSHVTFHAEYPLLATIGHNDLHVLTGDALHRVTRIRRESSTLMRVVIERGNEEGVFHCPQPWLAVAAIASMGIRLASWYRAPGHTPDDDAEGYAAAVRDWLPSYEVEQVGDTFAAFALALAGVIPSTDRATTRKRVRKA
jgi:AcrR family transcriptional regulator